MLPRASKKAVVNYVKQPTLMCSIIILQCSTIVHPGCAITLVFSSCAPSIMCNLVQNKHQFDSGNMRRKKVQKPLEFKNLTSKDFLSNVKNIQIILARPKKGV